MTDEQFPDYYQRVNARVTTYTKKLIAEGRVDQISKQIVEATNSELTDARLIHAMLCVAYGVRDQIPGWNRLLMIVHRWAMFSGNNEQVFEHLFDPELGL